MMCGVHPIKIIRAGGVFCRRKCFTKILRTRFIKFVGFMGTNTLLKNFDVSLHYKFSFRNLNIVLLAMPGLI